MRVLEAEFLIALTHPPSVLTVSGGVQDLLGFAPDDFLSGKVSLSERIHADDQDLASRLFADEKTHPFDSFPIRIRQAHGQIRIVRVHYTKTRSAATNEVQLHLSLQCARSLFRRAQPTATTEEFRSMLEYTDDFIFFKDENHVITAASQTLATICPPAQHWTDLLGKTDYEIFPEKRADAFYQLEKRIYAGEHIAREIQVYQTTDGKKCWVDNRKYPVLNRHGKITGLFGVARDVTDNTLLTTELKRQARTDYLTGVNNRRHFMVLAQRELDRSMRYHTPLSLLMMDIDHFKLVNDNYGHEVGDAVLIKLAEVCQQTLRGIDSMGRIGGEEFAILLPETDIEQALEVAERVRMALAHTRLDQPNSRDPLRFTVSLGIATLAPNIATIDVLLSLADHALYQAKNTGRNKVCVQHNPAK